MLLKKHVNSIFDSICYKVGNLLIDPGDVWEGFEETTAVLLTHAHFDHIYGLNNLLDHNSNILVYTNNAGKEMLLNPRKNMSYYHETAFTFRHPDNIRLISDRDMITFSDKTKVEAVFTPGHNQSCITWVIDNLVFSGDSLIPGLKTVTNLPGGNKEFAKLSEKIINSLLIGRTLCPGHTVQK